MKNAILYLRASSAKQERSCGEQETDLRAFAKELGADVARVFKDDGISGSEFGDKRPGLQELLKYCGNGNGLQGDRLVLVRHLDRLGRPEDPDELAAVRWNLKRAGWRILSMARGASEDRRTTALLDVIEADQAGSFLRNLAEKTASGIREAMRRGSHVGRPPYGLAIEVRDATGKIVASCARGGTPPRGRGYVSRLVLGDPVERGTVRKVFNLAAGGVGLRCIARRLNADGIPSPAGRAWAVGTVRNVLLSPVYSGVLSMNRRTCAKFHSIEGAATDKGKASNKAPGCAIVHERKDLAVVSRSTWDKVQSLLAERGAKARSLGGRAGQRHPLSGVLRCGACGGPMKYVDGRYMCATYHVGKGCAAHSVPAVGVEEAAIAYLEARCKALLDEREIRKAAEDYIEATPTATGRGEALRAALEGKRSEAGRLADKALDGSPTIAARARERVEKLEGEIEVLAADLAALPADPPAVDLEALTREALAVGKEIGKALREGGAVEIREAIEALGIKLVRDAKTPRVLAIEDGETTITVQHLNNC
jgi:site-specific DNA recombinase